MKVLVKGRLIDFSMAGALWRLTPGDGSPFDCEGDRLRNYMSKIAVQMAKELPLGKSFTYDGMEIKKVRA